MDQFIRTARVPQGACQHARHSAYAMCYAASERLAWQSLLAVRLVAVAALRALVDLVLLFHFFVLIVLLTIPRTQQVLALLMDDGAGAASLR